ncbi:MAG: HpcH/HpaI aldolase/citrate lyase family protein [Cyclobacteriaceae bacterium]
MKSLKVRLAEGETLHGCWLNLGSSLTAEIAGLAGFDWLLVDLEHGMGDEQDLIHQLQAIRATPAAPLVRVESHDKQRIHRALDAGAEGVMCPQISNLEEAKEAVSGWQYPPDGKRGVSFIVPTTQYGPNFTDYQQAAKDTILGIIQVETEEVLNDLDEIAALDGVDVLFVGPADLSMSLGIFRQYDHPRFKEALAATVDATQRAGKVAGIILFDPDDYPTYREIGFRLIGSGSDGDFMAYGARTIASKLAQFRDSTKNQDSL